MIIGLCTLKLYLPGTASLKEKRGQLKPLLNQLRKRFEVAVAEVEHQDVWQTAAIAIVTVANDTRHVHTVLDRAVNWIEEQHPEMEILDWQVELR
ncbi:MAG: DUF503 domain-containing protein [Anaerolineales bacterium]